MLEFVAVSKEYKAAAAPVPVLRNLDLEIAAGERVAIMGPSGSGKSTLLNLACGLDRPSAGEIRLDGVALSDLPEDERTRLRRERIGMVFQTFNLLPTLTALENVALPLRLRGTARRAADAQAMKLLDCVGLAARAHHRPDELSGGERQRAAIGRALVYRPALVLADEPTGNLDSTTGTEILRLLAQLQREYGMTLLIVTHNPEAGKSCERLIRLHDGRIVSDERA